MNRLSLSDAQKHLPETMRRISRRKSPVIVTYHGKDLVAVMSISTLNRLLEERQDKSDGEEALRRLADPDEKRISFEQVCRKLGID